MKNRELIEKHLRFVLKENERVNLTAIRDYHQAKLLHLEDSLAALRELASAPDGALCDMGSGAGFPGIPLALASGRATVLLESVQKKAAVLQKFVERENLSKQIMVVAKRIEEYSKSGEGHEHFSAVVARALAPLSSLLELAAPLLKRNGQLITYKTPKSKIELEEIEDKLLYLGYELKSKRDFCLSDLKTERTLYVFKKSGSPKFLLPRKIGLAQHQPLLTKHFT